MDLNIKELQKIATEMLKEVTRICEENKLPYVAMFGSLIGAIRHHGPIPWDYDIDIAIPEYSLDNFLDVMSKHLSSKYFIEYRNKSEHLTFPRIGLTGYKTDILHIDVYRIVGYPENERDIKRIFKMRSYTHRLIELKYKPLNAVSEKKKILATIIKPILPFISTTYLLSLFDKYSGETNYLSAKHVACGINGIDLVAREDFDDTILVPYVDFYIRVPSNYDKILRQMYGDYLKYPPVQERQAGIEALYKVDKA